MPRRPEDAQRTPAAVSAVSPEDARAWSLARRYLRYGARSTDELRAYLRARDVEESVVSALVRRCRQQGILDDRVCAKLLATALGDAGYAREAVRERLLAKRIPAGLVEAALAAWPERDERARADAALQALLRRSGRIQTDGARARRRAAGFLARRGFDPEVIEQVLDRGESATR